jgi:hypothetical protein
MTLPISGGQIANDYQTLWNAINAVKSDCLNVQANTASGASGSLQWFLQLAQDVLALTNTYDGYTSNQTIANGIIAYAQQQAPGVTFSGTDFANMRTAAGAILTAIAAQYPVDSGGKLADRTWSSTSGVVWATATAAQVPTIMTAITGFLATLS